VPKDLARVEDHKVAGRRGPIPIRVYAADTASAGPALVYFHGGRFISGNLETHDPVCRDLAIRSRWVIVAVDYRVAPEHRFPAALEDAYDATSWISANGRNLGIDADLLGVGGDSAGANLAAGVALLDRDRSGGTLKCQVLVYPMLDPAASLDSHRTFATGFGPGSEDMIRGWREYLGEEIDPLSPQVSPFFAEDLRGLPPALVQTAECDPLRDEGEAYARRLDEAGVPVVSTRYDGMIHGFFQMAGVLEAGRHALQQVTEFLENSLKPADRRNALHRLRD